MSQTNQPPNPSPAILWLRRDLRLDDNAALTKALETGRPVIPVFIHAPEEEGRWAPGAASRWWLHHALADLDARLRDAGSRLLIREGASLESLCGLIEETGARAVYWNRLYDPATVRRDREIKEALREQGVEVHSTNSSLLFAPQDVRNRAGTPFRVFTPFYKHTQTLAAPAAAVSDCDTIPAPKKSPKSLPLKALDLLPRIPWDDGIDEAWNPTRRGGLDTLEAFIDGPAVDYSSQRDLPAVDGTSRLSPYLHWGQIGPREVRDAAGTLRGKRAAKAEPFLRQLVWREFAHHLLFHFPETPQRPLHPQFEAFPWQPDPVLLEAWQRGRTGYPIVDAGMRQLWQTGWMHNRVRMNVASLLVKHLLQPWHEGADWFWDTLVDADLANNTLGWQWTAGCGADAAPYFRIFNPVIQGKKFDPEGEFVRRFVPELAAMPAEFIHRPWDAPDDVLKDARVELGATYPRPVIAHEDGRRRALAALGEMKAATA